MKTKMLVLLVALCAAAPLSVSAMSLPNQRPQLIITVDYMPDAPAGKPHLFYGWRAYFRYFFPCWP